MSTEIPGFAVWRATCSPGKQGARLAKHASLAVGQCHSDQAYTGWLGVVSGWILAPG